MKVYNVKHKSLTKNLKETLNYIRLMRGFNSKEYIQAKTYFLNEYMINNSLSACVVAISGGIDSAAVLSLVVDASKQENSPIKKIVAISLPVLDTLGATNQTEVIEKAKKLCENLNIKLDVFYVNKSFEQIYNQVDKALEQNKPDNWARGQLVAYSRTPYLYYTTSVLSSQGFGSIIVGTTNRDEGSYLGYVGKASDGMVDIQLISDLHKSEVYLISKELNVPEEIISATPSGDMYDGRSDEEVFGAPYDFVEIYLNYKNISTKTWNWITKFWDEKDKEQFSSYSTALEKLHKYNQHKYWSGSQAIHLDVLDSAVKDGWREGVHTTIHKNKTNKIIPTHRFVGFVSEPPQLLINKKIETQPITQEVNQIKNVLTMEEVENILKWRKINEKYMVKTNEYGRVEDNNTGSNRLSFYCEDFAQIISERIRLSGAIQDLKIFTEKDNTNWHPYQNWRFTGINPMVRLMEYDNGNYLVPHYDDSFYESETKRSLITLVIVLENNCSGGATRFLIDNQNNIAFNKRDFSDWDREPQKNEISFEVKPHPGNAIIFSHRLLHDGERINNGKKIILRTELMFEVCSSNLLKK